MQMLIQKSDIILVTGHRGMVGSALIRTLSDCGYDNLATVGREQVDLCDLPAVEQVFRDIKPAVVLHAAAMVGGIQANIDHPADFLSANASMALNVIGTAARSGVKRLCFLGSSCVYPRAAPQPMPEDCLLTGPFEPTNEGYALAKVLGLRFAEYCHRQLGLNAFSVMPCNLYGTKDHYDLQRSHVVTALVKRFVDAADETRGSVTLWGTGSARRELMHVEDAAKAIVFLLERYLGNDHINVGTGEDVTIRELAELVAACTGFRGKIDWDATKPDGMPRKCLDVSRLRGLGFKPTVTLDSGIERTVSEYRELKREGKA